MGSCLITDATVFTGEEFLPSAYVLVENGKISYVGNDKPTTGQHQVISRPGHTLLPGLIDAHVHSIGGDTTTLSQALQFGVTTVLEMGNSYLFIEKLREAAKHSDMADYRTATVPGTVPGGYPEPMLLSHNPSEETKQDLATWPKLRTTADAEAFINRSIEAKADYIKLLQESGRSMGIKLPTPTQEIQTAVIKAAHAHGLKVVGHALSLEDTLVLLRSGIDGMAHTFFDTAPNEELISAYRATGAWCCPTLVMAASMTGEISTSTQAFANQPQVHDKISQSNHEVLCKCIDMKGPGCSLQHAIESVRALKEAGIDIVCGTDASTVTLGTTHGVSLHQELRMYVEDCGLSITEALKSATSVTARCFGLTDRGAVAEGKRADLLLIEGDLTNGIEQSLNCKLVWKEGILKDISS